MGTGKETGSLASSKADSEAQAPYRLTIQPSAKRVKVVFNGEVVADSDCALLMLETRLAPVYYLPREDVRRDLLLRTEYHTHCHRAFELKPSTILKTLQSLDAFRRPERFAQFLLACEADARGRQGFEDNDYPAG